MIRTSIIQADLAWENKTANLERFAQKISALKGSTEIIILPEMFSTGFSMNINLAETMEGESLQWMKSQASRHRMIIAGSLMIKDRDQYFNRMVWMQPDGKFACYDKRHLFAYAGEDKYFTPGHKRLVASAGGIRFMLQVCYDLRFPVWSRQQDDEYDVLVYVANWPVKRSHAWKSLLVARAIENQCYVIGVNRVGTDGNGHQYSGDSMVIDPMGEILFHLENEEGAFTFSPDIEKLKDIRTQLPFLKDADSFQLQLTR